MSTNVVGAATPHQAPNAAMLIDFDNVTMGIRSDLQEELKNLLSSDIIKGKVAVRRAYADWRRYPQYIVPLTEASIDLIFAPAYGSAKKNATDIRLAIDALELVFTRPEIGTFVLLSGDSDFSSMVIKLKEYGKYVIGVGIRESSSDLLVMNCDEYYSYNALAGLVRSGDEESTRWDPYELVTEAVQRMKRNGDVMRSDRLKQVMQEIDASFDEKNLGMPKFSRFVQEAQSRGLLTVTKLENGQMEIGAPAGTPASIEAAPAAAATADKAEGDEGDDRGTPAEREERRSRRGRRGRGRDRDREERPRSATAVADAEGADAADAAAGNGEATDAAPVVSTPAVARAAAPAAAPAAPAAASDVPLGAVARVGAVAPATSSRSTSPTAAARPAPGGDVPLGAVARVGSVTLPSAAAKAAPAAPASAEAPLGAVARVGEQTDRPAREGRNDRGRGRGRDRDRGLRTDAARTDAAASTAAPAAGVSDDDTIGLSGEKLTRSEAFDLVQKAVTALVSGNNTTSAFKVREKAFELLGRDSETLAARMFERILRDAHDADVIDLRRRGDDYEVGRVAEAASIAEQLAKKEAELAQVKKDADKASGASGPTGLGTRGRMAGRGGRMGGRAGGAPPELLMVGVVKSAGSPAAAPAAPAAAVAAAESKAAESAVTEAATAASAETSKKADKAASKSTTKSAKKAPAKKSAKSATKTGTKTASKSAGTKAAKPKAPAKTAAKSAPKAAAKTASKAASKSESKPAAKSAAPAKKAAKKSAKKASS